MDKPLPNSPESERALLGSIIINNETLRTAKKSLAAEDFYAHSHQLVFRAMASLADSGAEINPILIGEELRRQGLLEQAGGVAYISDLTYGIPYTADVSAYAKIIGEKSARRQFIKACQGLAGEALENCELGTTLMRADALLNSIGDVYSQSARGRSSFIRILRMGDVAPEDVSWLWAPYIPHRKLTILEGDPGVGKSWLTCALAAAVSRGHGLPGADPSEPRNVLMLSAEDGLADTLRPRLDAVDADVERVFALDEPLTLDQAGLCRLESAIAKHKPTLMIVDPLFAYTGGKVDINRANECRVITAALKDLAERQDCAIVALRHLTKGAGRTTMSAGLGSVDIRAAARSVLLVGADPDDPSRRAIIQTKSNLAPEGHPVGYKIEGGRFQWTGKSDLTAARILGAPSGVEEIAGRNEAVDFLRTVLADGPRTANEVKADASQLGITEQMLRTARVRLKVIPKKKGQPGSARQCWVWSLPEDVASEAEGANGSDGQLLPVTGENKGPYSQQLAEGVEAHGFHHLRGREVTPSAYSPGQTGCMTGGLLKKEVKALHG